MADILSQDEIDRLLGAAGTEPTPEVAELHPSEVDAVEKLTAVFFASANSALGTLLARPASVAAGLGQVVELADLDGAKSFVMRFPFRSGFTGEMAFLLPHREASALADLILGGDGTTKDALEESDLDALKEALTQVAGSGAPNLSSAVGREVGFDPPEGQEVEAGQLAGALPWRQAFLAAGTLKVDGVLEAPLRLLLPVELAREMARLAREDEEAPPAVQSRPTTAPPAPPPKHDAASSGASTPEIRNIDLILDIEVEVMVRLGEAQMPLRGIQRLRPGSILDLDKDTDAPVELVVNDKVIAKGELVVVSSDHFALRITEIETPVERIRRLGP